jgi:hypothetical protein
MYDNDIYKFPQGLWFVDETIPFINKYDALVTASKLNKPVNYAFFHHIFDNFKSRKDIGKYSLDFLYKRRAEQLREKYDYLILYFSGGSDSFNVLRTFIDNNIKLDEVCVKWATPTLNSNRKIYDPNNQNSSAENYLSEWNYAIRPVLLELRKRYPEIKLELVNWLPEVEKGIDENLFQSVNHWHDIELPSMTAYSPNESKLILQGKTVGSIYGIDKPKTFFKSDGTACMFFSDGATGMGVPNPINIYGTEYFYWTPDMPLLAFEMARVSILWQLQTKERFNRVSYREEIRDFERGQLIPYWAQYVEQEEGLRHVLYSTWSHRFQSTKPLILDRKDKHKWIYEHDQLKTYRESFQSIQHSMMKNINSDFYSYSGQTNSYMFKPSAAPLYPVIENYHTYLERAL